MAGPVVAERLHDILLRLFGLEAPVRLYAWDGSVAGPTDAPAVRVHSRRAVRRLLWRPDELGLARAFVAGEIEVDGPILTALERLAPFGRSIGARPELTAADRSELMRAAVYLGAVGPAPKPPEEEITGAERRHALDRDTAPSGSPDNPVGTPFLAKVFGQTLMLGSGYWADPGMSLDDAQRAGLQLACRKLGLADRAAGERAARVLDVDCGWGTFLLHAAEHHAVTGLGITSSAEQAEQATKRAVDAGLAGRVEFRVADWREVEADPFDAIVAYGLADYVGADRLGEYARTLHGLLRPGGRLLVNQVGRRGEPLAQERSFLDAYVHPGAELLPVGTVTNLVENAGLEVRDVETMREHYARTLRAWVANLEGAWDECARQASPARARVWLLYLAVSALTFESARISAYQLLVVRPHTDGRAPLPATRSAWRH